MKIMHTMASEANARHRTRRFYSPELKSQIVAECQTQGASVAGVALSHGINANIVHRWLREHDGTPAVQTQGFVALTLQAPTPDASVPASAPGATERDIRVEVRRGAGCVTVNWPLEGAASCRAWLHDLLR
ncbi:MAG: transposase [Comamonadaceae bacterium]|jgi:transposase|nr:transposase [Comamonadaceae bacterium]